MNRAQTKRLEALEVKQAPQRKRDMIAALEAVLSASFGQQRAFIDDGSKFITGVCSRRAGKTNGCASKLLRTAVDKPGSACLYLTKTRLNAKRIVWGTLLDMNRVHDLGGVPNESELCLKMLNGSVIYLGGVNDKSEVDKWRGLPLALVIVDEAQSLPAYIAELVDDVIEPALMDYDGQIALVGTPGSVPTGYFHGCALSDQWSHHAWTVFDNPWIERKGGKTAQQHLEAALKRRGIGADDPSIQREFYGRWVLDTQSLVFRYSADLNHFESLPVSRFAWQHVIGVDLGFDDADAIGVIGWTEDAPSAYLVEEWTGAKQGITELGDRLKLLEAKYKPLKIVVDTGGLGKKIAAEITQRFAIPLEAAEKPRKFEYIELVNDALRTGRLYARRDGRFANDCMLVEWDRSKPETPKISERYHSDVADAVLYAYREALHWLHVEPETPPDAEDAMDLAEDEQFRQEEQERRGEVEGFDPVWED